MGDKRAAKRDTKAEIFMAAADLFAENGYAGTSMKDIAKKTGIQAASIYNHYASKEEILDALLELYTSRMEPFYKRLAEIDIGITRQDDLGQALSKLMLAYEPEEVDLMYKLTRIVHHEQFTSHQAAEALIGAGYKKFVAAHIHFFDRLSDAGFICGKENNKFYGELYARLSLTFGTQFLHPEITPTIDDQTVLGDFVNRLVMGHEKTLRKAAQGGAE